MGLTVVFSTQGPQMSANWSQAGSHFPYLAIRGVMNIAKKEEKVINTAMSYLIASLHFAGHFGTQGPQRELNWSQLGSHWPDLRQR